MSDADLVLCVLGAVIVLFASNRVPVEIVAVGAAVALAATGVLDLPQALAGFGDPTVVFIATVFVVSHALDATGVTAWAGERLVAVASGDQRRLLVAVMVLVAGLAAIVSANGAVAALVPMVVLLGLRQRVAASRLLIPVAFAAQAGSLLALTGTPVNVLVYGAISDTGATIGFFAFALAGLPLLAGMLVVVTVLGPRLLPERRPSHAPVDLSAHAETLSAHYLDGRTVVRLTAATAAPWPVVPAGVQVVGVQPGGTGSPREPSDVLQAGDVVIVRGDAVAIGALAAAAGLTGAPGSGALVDRRQGVAELVIPPRSGLVGTVVFPGMVTPSGDLVILAVQHHGDDVMRTALVAGDTVLVQGSWEALGRELAADRDVLAVDDPRELHRQAVPLGRKSWEAIGVTAAMVVVLVAGVVEPAAAGLLAVGALVVLRVVPIADVYRAVSWTAVVLVAGLMALSTAMLTSGAADRIAAVVDGDGAWSPRLVLLGLFAVAVALGAFISNTATALVLLPVAAAVATDLGVSATPLLVGVGVGCTAAFLTPVSTAANLMVHEPGGYRFGDYWRLGLPLVVLYGVVVVGWVPVVWRF